MDRRVVMEQVEREERRLGEVVVGDLEPYKNRLFRMIFRNTKLRLRTRLVLVQQLAVAQQLLLGHSVLLILIPNRMSILVLLRWNSLVLLHWNILVLLRQGILETTDRLDQLVLIRMEQGLLALCRRKI